MAQRPVPNYTHTSFMQHVSHSIMSVNAILLLSICLPQIALEAPSEHENTKKFFRGHAPRPPSYMQFPPFVDSLTRSAPPENIVTVRSEELRVREKILHNLTACIATLV